MINKYENTLRNLIILLLGEEPSKYNLSEERIKKWSEKKEIELKKHIGLKENRIIYYSDFYDLKTIINKNWEIFLPVLNNKKRFEIFFEELENYRNNIAHGRELLYNQKLLLEGIYLDLKNLIAIYHNKNEMKDDYFVRINKVSDNLGNIWITQVNSCKNPLRVGEIYELIVEAVDPKDREIEYEISTFDSKLKIVQKENFFRFEISENLISKSIMFLIKVRTPNSEYKNETQFQTVYSIIPKL